MVSIWIIYGQSMDNLWIWLVVEPYPSEKYEFVNIDDDIPNISGKIKVMFQTTNQCNIMQKKLYYKIPSSKLA